MLTDLTERADASFSPSTRWVSSSMTVRMRGGQQWPHTWTDGRPALSSNTDDIFLSKIIGSNLWLGPMGHVKLIVRACGGFGKSERRKTKNQRTTHTMGKTVVFLRYQACENHSWIILLKKNTEKRTFFFSGEELNKIFGWSHVLNMVTTEKWLS